jgi:PIN domain nuclease of toxin-antitoxin system
VNLLLDTHAFLWIVNGGPLSQTARSLFMDTENKLFFSAASYWEISIKLSIGKLSLADDWAEQFDVEMAANGIQWLPIAPEHCRKIIELPLIHQDPFDRLLIAQALCEDMTIVTADGNIQAYSAATAW